jgi:hypothetical protein
VSWLLNEPITKSSRFVRDSGSTCQHER